MPDRIHSRRWGILAVLCLSLLMVVVDNTIVNVALPTLSDELDASITELQWVVDSYTLVFAALLLAFGHLGDRFGRKLALQVGLVIFAGTSLLAAFSSTSGQLIGARALMGIGAALVFPATLAILVNVFTDKRERVMAIGIWSACTGLAVALGPVTGGFLLEHFAWGSIFLVNIPLTALALIAGWVLVPNSKDADAGRLDVPGLLLSVAAVALVVWAIIEAPNFGWTSVAVVSAGTIGIILGAVFVAWERRLSHPLLDVRLFRNLRFTAASGAVTTAFFALFGFIFLITQYLQLVQGYSPLEAGVRTLPFAIATGITSPLAMLAMRRWGTKAVVATGLSAMAVGFVAAAQLKADTPYVGLTLISMVVIAIGLGLTTGPATESIMGALPAEKGRRRFSGQRHDSRTRRHIRSRRRGVGVRERVRGSRCYCASPARTARIGDRRGTGFGGRRTGASRESSPRGRGNRGRSGPGRLRRWSGPGITRGRRRRRPRRSPRARVPACSRCYDTCRVRPRSGCHSGAGSGLEHPHTCRITVKTGRRSPADRTPDHARREPGRTPPHRYR